MSSQVARSQEKAELQAKLDAAEERVHDLVTLEARLEQAIEQKRGGISNAELASGTKFEDEDAGVGIVYAAASSRVSA